MYFQTIYTSPIGSLLLKATNEALIQVQFDGVLEGEEKSNDILKKTIEELSEYFDKKRNRFEIPLLTEGTAFQKTVWKQLQQIPYGQKISYLQLSKQLKNPLAIRAIASANGKNPIPIIIPCHRVVGSKGELVGFTGGLWRKQFLLDLEGGALF